MTGSQAENAVQMSDLWHISTFQSRWRASTRNQDALAGMACRPSLCFSMTLRTANAWTTSSVRQSPFYPIFQAWIMHLTPQSTSAHCGVSLCLCSLADVPLQRPSVPARSIATQSRDTQTLQTGNTADDRFLHFPGKQGGRKRKANFFASDDTSPEKASVSFNKVVSYSTEERCRRAMLLEHFGERLSGACQGCDYCLEASGGFPAGEECLWLSVKGSVLMQGNYVH